MFIEPVKEEEVTTVISNFKNSAPGHDEITEVSNASWQLFIILLCIVWICYYLKVYFLMNWRLLMLLPCTKLKIPRDLTITKLYYVSCQKF